MAAVRGDRIAMIFREPMSSLIPPMSIGAHVAEPLRLHRRISRREARAQAIGLLDRVGIPSAAKRYDDYPHRMSGGMRQRVMIAAVLACEPALLIADELTTALDVTIQAQIMDLLSDLQVEFGMGILSITRRWRRGEAGRDRGFCPGTHRTANGCRFAPRCARAAAACRSADPPLATLGADHAVACIHPLEAAA